MPNLFEGDEADGYAAYDTVEKQYVALLISNPPIPTLMPGKTPELHVRERIAVGIARKDVPRVLRAIREAGLTEEQIAAMFREDAERAARHATKDSDAGKAA